MSGKETSLFQIDELNEELSKQSEELYQELLNTTKSLSQDMIMLKSMKKTAVRTAKQKLNKIQQLSKQLSNIL